MDLTLVSCVDLPEPDLDEQLLLAALADRGVAARVAAWDDPGVDWSAAALTVVRSTWNYVDDRDGFLQWMRRVSAERTVLRNPLPTMAPNTHKGYLAGLERAGLPVVPTRWFAKEGARRAAPDDLRKLPWDRVIVKPAVGAGSRAVRAFDLRSDDDVARAAAHVASLQDVGEVLVQPQLRSILEEGERDIVWIDGACTHVVTKLSRLEGDAEHATVARAPSDAERQLVASVLRTVPAYEERALLYARVDVAADELGVLRIIELELVEPSLFLYLRDEALDRFARALARESSVSVA